MYFLKLDKIICDLHALTHPLSGASCSGCYSYSRLECVGDNELSVAFHEYVVCVGEYDDTWKLLLECALIVCMMIHVCVCVSCVCVSCVCMHVSFQSPHTHTHTHTHARTHTHTHMHAHVRTRTHMHARARTHMHARARTHMHARARTHAHTTFSVNTIP